jgi:hypothetical protein
MEIQRRVDFKGGFSINAQDLRELHDLMESQLKKILGSDESRSDFSVTFQNDTTSAKLKLEQILSMENSGVSEIIKIHMSIRSQKNWDQGLTLDFKKEDSIFDPPIRLSIKADHQDWVEETIAKFSKRIARLKNYKAKHFNYLRFLAPVGLICVAVSFLVSSESYQDPIVVAKQALSQMEKSYGEGKLRDPIAAMIEFERAKIAASQTIITNERGRSVLLILRQTGWLMMALPWVLIKGVTFFFPPYNFLWGEYVKTYEQRRRWGTLVFGALGTVVGAILTDVVRRLVGL